MNPYRKLLSLLPSERIDVGTIMENYDGSAKVVLQDGGVVIVRGNGSVGGKVYIKGGSIEGSAPSLTGTEIPI